MSSPSSGSPHLTPGHHHSSSSCVNTLSASSRLWHSVPGCPFSWSPFYWCHALTLPGVSPHSSCSLSSHTRTLPHLNPDLAFVETPFLSACALALCTACLPSSRNPFLTTGQVTTPPCEYPLKLGLALTHTPGRYGSLPSAPNLAGPYSSFCHFVFMA